jgi:protein gp37
MGMRTFIQWCDSTVNPTTGCDGCELWELLESGPCYAGHLHEERLALAMPELYAPSFAEVRLAPGRMAKAASWSDLRGLKRPDKPWLDGRPRVIFVGDMGDVFSKAVPFEYLRDELIQVATSKPGRRHIWMVLTKQSGRLARFASWLTDQGIAWPENVWPGTSVTRQATLGRAKHLLNVPAMTHFLSVEPMLENIDIEPYLYEHGYESGGKQGWVQTAPPVRLVIYGGESDQAPHQGRPFDIEWAREGIFHCGMAGVACFVKQLGSAPYDSSSRISIDGPDSHAVALNLRDSHGGDWSEWPGDLRVRQFPEVSQ